MASSTSLTQAGADPARSELLGADDPFPVRNVNPQGRSRFLLLGDHAGQAVPTRLGGLGIARVELDRHIGWDIGILALGEALAVRLDAPFLSQTYSRLVIDCNRDPARADAMPATSDGTAIPANAALTDAERGARVAAIHAPYQQAIADALAARDAAGVPTILVALHSFTPAMQGIARPWHAGILHDGGDTGFAQAMLAVLRDEGDLVVGDNEPYRMDLIDHTIPRHAYAARRPYAEIEIRQDLLVSPGGILAWADRLARLLPAAADLLPSGPIGQS